LLEVSYQPTLVQDVVFAEIKKREGTEVYDEYYRLADDIYENEDHNRNKKFKNLDANFFRKLGLHEPINEVLSEFPEFEGRLNTIHVSIARNIREAGTDLSSDGNEVFLKLFPEDFSDTNHLRVMLRHEFMHITYMLDKQFGYKTERLSASPLQENIIKDRYRALWDIFIDSRLEEFKKESPCDKDERFREFQSLFKSVARGKDREIFEKLWGVDDFTHDRLKELAEDPALVVSYIDRNIEDAKELCPPGAPCPLCKFPTHKWVKDNAIKEEVAGLVRQDLSSWYPNQGVCETCYQYYLNKLDLLWI